MSRTIELGRAVLDSSVTQLQLWFTTLITISPQQNSIDIQHLKQTALLEYLSSGKVWVSRGYDMYIELEITNDGEPLGQRELHILGQQIINAPAWNQLNFSLSLAIDELSEDSCLSNHGKMHIKIKYSRNDVDTSTKGRLPSGVVSGNVTPPEGVPHLSLLSVQFVMQFLPVQQFVKSTTAKRRKKTNLVDSFDEINIEKVEFPSSGSVQMPLSEGTIDSDLLLSDKDEMLWSSPRSRKPYQNLKRSSDLPNFELACADQYKESSPSNLKKREQPSSHLRFSITSVETHPPSSLCGLEAMVDAAIRLAVSNNLPKPANGVRAKVNNFTKSLQDISPALWNPGYLLAFSQRSPFFTILSRSLGRSTNAKAKSLSLQDKFAELTTRLTKKGSDGSNQYLAHRQDDKTIINAVGAQLWMYTQRNLSPKTTGSLLAFCTSVSQKMSLKEVDDILMQNPSQREAAERISGLSDTKVTYHEENDSSLMTRASMKMLTDSQAVMSRPAHFNYGMSNHFRQISFPGDPNNLEDEAFRLNLG